MKIAIELVNGKVSGVYSDYDTVLSNIVKDWKVTTRSLEIGDILKPISKDILNSYIIREGLSNEVIGTSAPAPNISIILS